MRWIAFSAAALCSVGCRGGAIARAPDGLPLPLAEEAERPGRAVRRVAHLWSLAGDTIMQLPVPSSAHRGDSLTLSLWTSRGGCVESDTTVTTVVGSTVRIVPYERYVAPVPPNGYCAEVLRIGPPQPIRLVLDSIGETRVTVIHRNGSGAGLQTSEWRIFVK